MRWGLTFGRFNGLNPNFPFFLTPEDANYLLIFFFEEYRCLVEVYRRFRGMQHLHHQVRKLMLRSWRAKVSNIQTLPPWTWRHYVPPKQGNMQANKTQGIETLLGVFVYKEAQLWACILEDISTHSFPSCDEPDICISGLCPVTYGFETGRI